MKNIIMDIIKQYPNNYSIKIKNDPDLYNWIIDNSRINSDNYPEMIYSAINDETNICKNDNKKKFLNIKEGFGFCGKAGTCECAKEYMSNKIKESYKNKEEDLLENIDQTIELKINNNDKEYLINLINDNKKNYPNLIKKSIKEKILVLMKKYPDIKKISEASYILINDMDGPPLCDCGNNFKVFNTIDKGYRKFCSTMCDARKKHQSELLSDINNNISEEEKIRRLEKQRKAMLDRYGEEYLMHIPEFVDKIKNTNLQKYGVEYVTQSPEIRKKIEDTNIKKYGVSYPFQLDEIQQKTLSSFKENNPEYNTAVDLAREKYLEQNDGVNAFVVHRDKVVESMNELYNVNHPSESEELLERRKQKANERLGRNSHTQTHIPDEAWEIISNKDKFEQEYINRGISGLSDLLGIGYGVIYRKLDFYNINRRLRSSSEEAMKNFLLGLGLNLKTNNRSICTYDDGTYQEVDFLIENMKLCIEYDGLYWHSTKYRDFMYHYDKLGKCNQKGYDLLNIFEDEWVKKYDVVTNKIKEYLNLFEYEHINDMRIDKLTNNISKTFMEKHSLKYSPDSPTMSYGIYNNNILCSVVDFIKNENGWVIINYADDIDNKIRGSYEYIIDEFIKDVSPNDIHLYIDRRWENGNRFINYGFNKIGEILPKYWFFKSNNLNRISRNNICNILNISNNTNINDIINMTNENKYHAISDCGYLKLKLSL